MFVQKTPCLQIDIGFFQKNFPAWYTDCFTGSGVVYPRLQQRGLMLQTEKNGLLSIPINMRNADK